MEASLCRDSAMLMVRSGRWGKLGSGSGSGSDISQGDGDMMYVLFLY
jgi:hypothetical protein